MTLTPPFPLAITMSQYNTTTKVDPAYGITLEHYADYKNITYGSSLYKYSQCYKHCRVS